MGAKVTGPDGKDASRSRWAPTASARRACRRDHRGEPRRAGIIWPRASRPSMSAVDQPEGRRRRQRPRLRGALRTRSNGRRQGRALRRQRPARRRQVRDRRPDRHAVAGHRRPARRCQPARSRSSTARPASARRCRSPKSSRASDGKMNTAASSRRPQAQGRSRAFEWLVAWRYLRARRKESGFISVIASLLPRHHARRRDAHRRHVGDERLSRRASRAASSASTAILSCSRSTAARRLSRRSPQRINGVAGREVRDPPGRRPGAGIGNGRVQGRARWCAA